jgi:hypothetical protein
MRTVLTWLGIGSAILGAYVAKTFFNLTEFQIAIGFLAIVVVVLSHQINALRDEKPKFKKKRLHDLFYSEPIKVQHKPPNDLTPDGKQRWGAEDYDFECFRALWFFGQAANQHLEYARFRLQEIGETEISGDLSSDGPEYGRRYEIFYNQVKLGLLQIMARHERHFDKQDRSVYAEITIDGVPVTALPYENVYGFLVTIASLVTSTSRRPHDGPKTEYEAALSDIQYKLMDAMWRTSRDYTLTEQSTWFWDFKVRLCGTPDLYYAMESHARGERKPGPSSEGSPFEWILGGTKNP